MSAWRQEFPILAEHTGKWQGEYVHLDPTGAVVDRHTSLLHCWMPQDGPYDIVQTNTYTWPDGRQEEVEFGGRLEGGDVLFENDRITGHMHQTDARTILLTWSNKNDQKPGSYLYEMIQLSQDGQQMVRTWHWMENDRLVKRTIICESKVA